MTNIKLAVDNTESKAVEIFNFEGNDVRTVMYNDEVYFVGKDVAEVLGYKDLNKAITMHVEKEDLETLMYKAYDKTCASLWGGNDYSNKTIINESGLYDLIMSSKLERAKLFKRWVTKEVLPSIRKHGAYMTESVLEQTIANPDFLIGLATQLKKEQTARLKAEQAKAVVEKQLIEQAPLVDYAKAISTHQDEITLKDMAGLLNNAGVKIGQNKLASWMRNEGYLLSGGNYYNKPSQAMLNAGYMTVKENTYQNGFMIKVSFQPMFTAKGQEYFIKKLMKEVA